ncbi:hypothetical protein [Chelatococcus asaccharovorans]|uniref:Uncharacterized protein n=1 Tax=Chelatococcus asaccharovorans TaxID=28210 RepID=A0A2V3U3V8_9HYPH|nr:hypothetical protein [Chelatococcus asaccharovorans]MBS7702673.1 hypothetical protein [Chelatococcus asaccharovorans]PXW56968.1 hypothetical protein C7450_1075 [Chelatococcus asaccharovorans]
MVDREFVDRIAALASRYGVEIKPLPGESAETFNRRALEILAVAAPPAASAETAMAVAMVGANFQDLVGRLGQRLVLVPDEVGGDVATLTRMRDALARALNESASEMSGLAHAINERLEAGSLN